MNVLDALNWRYAVNQFSEQTLSQEAIDGLIESVRLAPSSYGVQPFKLLVVENPALKQACLTHSYGQQKVIDNSHLLVLAHKTSLNEADIEDFIEQLAANQNRPASDLRAYQDQIASSLLGLSQPQQAAWDAQQCFIALGTLVSHAAVEQIDACPMTGFDSAGLNEVLGLDKQGLNAVIICPVGVRSGTDRTANRPKFRLSRDQLVETL
ncbi:NAD(P)H-dependent oxidoreductase [Grimontia sp. S25]|uniref:NAD(P)H-dependent oxidoreductase n=1 Tax=Grimontia sedimenti TaxID=2711294 RepID=A0A6M1RJH5_9GAMM|nr:nitroreductase family protein [Grimontia sedimenti]NGN97878.1 NAD(P)H-dependent oxidoreductase [Grimontia sedimenti]